jgi:hypothetical protein
MFGGVTPMSKRCLVAIVGFAGGLLSFQLMAMLWLPLVLWHGYGSQGRFAEWCRAGKHLTVLANWQIFWVSDSYFVVALLAGTIIGLYGGRHRPWLITSWAFGMYWSVPFLLWTSAVTRGALLVAAWPIASLPKAFLGLEIGRRSRRRALYTVRRDG